MGLKRGGKDWGRGQEASLFDICHKERAKHFYLKRTISTIVIIVEWCTASLPSRPLCTDAVLATIVMGRVHLGCRSQLGVWLPCHFGRNIMRIRS
jgi:hypothetical protein